MSFFDREEFLRQNDEGEIPSPVSDEAKEAKAEKEAENPPDDKEFERKIFWGNYTDIKTGSKTLRNSGIIILGSIVSAVIILCFCFASVAESYYGNGWLRNLLGLESRSEYTLDISERPASDSEYFTEDGRYTAAGIARELEQSVVSISSFSDIDIEGYFSAGRGSGIILSEDGYIVTNAHVIEDANDDMIVVTLSDGSRYNATVMGADGATDIAVIKIETSGLVPAVFGDSSQSILGEEVYAIGNPAGLEGSISRGIVSGLDRQVANYEYVRCIQVDAAVNPGNSGGALVNSWGQVIGIISSKLSSQTYDGIGFAICINDAKPVIDSLIKYGEARRNTRIGIEFISLSAEVTLEEDIKSGLYIMGIDENCDIYESGLELYDVITEIDGEAVSGTYEVMRILTGKNPGDTLTAKVYRPADGSEFEVSFSLMEKTGED